ncbi:hypothetical protein D9619_001548 [Psilocybe cf. subviscida]|uniref:PH domain-containing protein n=1 Tax=Psilocybe cf. subviscida TaxID=2480587 RepID=A0A8H5BHX6_9AGAR|nr:hypothetical protein D9619_001548 [Psilocybe cf. subviscida]
MPAEKVRGGNAITWSVAFMERRAVLTSWFVDASLFSPVPHHLLPYHSTPPPAATSSGRAYIMPARKSPLRDRLLSNSPDPIKSSILRESGMGWGSTSTSTNPASTSTSSSEGSGSITSPLRIAKREDPIRGPALARRTSSSYRHVHTNNLVSKSPFKSQIPAPTTATHRASVTFPIPRSGGEKRPRPSSMHELAETENERPFALKRDRKQSKTFQGLIEKEPVTKSPFRVQPRPPLPTTKSYPDTTASASIDIPRPTTPPAASSYMSPPAISPHNRGLSPGRSAMASKKLHGPRPSSGPKPEPRKVKFHDRCDVLEFDRDEDSIEDPAFQNSDFEDEDDYGQPVDQGDDQGVFDMDVSYADSSRTEDNSNQGTNDNLSYESMQMSGTELNPSVPSLLADPDTSITGIVEEMFFSSNAANLLADESGEPMPALSTPPRHHDIPTDLETEDGVPFGRTHHADRLMQHHQHQQQSPHAQPPPFSLNGFSPSHRSSPIGARPGSHPEAFNLPTHASPLGPPATPPRRPVVSHQSTPPLGRTTHAERIRQAREGEREEEVDAEDVARLPASPSPRKKSSYGPASTEESLVPRFDLPSDTDHGGKSERGEANSSGGVDLFAPRSQDHSILSNPEQEEGHDTTDILDTSVEPANISASNCDVNIHDLSVTSERDRSEVLRDLVTSPEPRPPSSTGSAIGRSPAVSEHGSGSALSRNRIWSPSQQRPESPLGRTAQPKPLTKTSSRERISREEVRRLMNQRSPASSPSTRELQSSSVLDSKPQSPAGVLGEAVPRTNITDSSLDAAEKENNRMSVLTTQTDFSTEDAVVFTAHKKTMSLPTFREEHEDEQEFGLLDTSHRLQFDFGSKFSLGGGLGLSASDIQVDSADLLSVSQTHSGSRPASIVSNGSGIKVGDVDVDMDMKSALDRLMEDVAGAGAPAEDDDDSMMTDEFDESFDRSMDRGHRGRAVDEVGRPKVVERAATDSVLLQRNEAADGILSRTVSSASGMDMAPPPVPPKDNIRQREQIILEKRRQARRLEEDDDEEEDDIVVASPRVKGQGQQLLGVGRPSRRRSMSTGDAETLGGRAKKRGDTLLEIATAANDRPLSDDIETELKKLVEKPKKSKYHVRERETTIYATSSEDRISHMAGPGDINTSRPWRPVRRPSDMNEYAQQIREFRALEKNKAYGKVFVKVLGIRHMNLPLPPTPTVVTCTLNNGIHFVTTPECELSSNCRIEQEFELIEHSKLEFTLTLKVRRDPHIIQQFKALVPSPAPPPQPISRPPSAVPPVKSSGMRSFFSSSPKKSSKVAAPPPPPVQQHMPAPTHRLPENLARHLKPDGTLARAFINFKDIASRCDTRLFETSYPLIGQRVELGGKFSTLEVGEIVLQVFRLPPLPGIPQDQQPQSLEECHRGLRHINWHKVTYFEGTLTQNGGDCSTWRRRPFRVIGSNLVAFNDVTKRAAATIDLKQAISVEDDQEPRRGALSPASGHRTRYGDEYDGLSGVKNSFRIVFPDDQEILFYADSDADKTRWLEVLRALVGHIPPHPLWAELLWQRQEEMTKRATASQPSLAPSSSFDPYRRS